MRVLCISDIHGQHNKLEKLLQKINYDFKKDQLILLGDYFDRGNENIKTIELVMNLHKQGKYVGI